MTIIVVKFTSKGFMMLRGQAREQRATEIYTAGQNRVVSTPEPKGQKFPCGSRVALVDGLLTGSPDRVLKGTVEYVYAHAYGGNDIRSYSINIDGKGSFAWYDEDRLTAIPDELPSPQTVDETNQVSSETKHLIETVITILKYLGKYQK